MGVNESVCVCLCMCECERERDKDSQTETDRNRDKTELERQRALLYVYLCALVHVMFGGQKSMLWSSPLLPYGLWGSNICQQAWWQILSQAEPSCQPPMG